MDWSEIGWTASKTEARLLNAQSVLLFILPELPVEGEFGYLSTVSYAELLQALKASSLAVPVKALKQ